MLSDDELPPLPDYLSPGSAIEYGRAVERAAYERAADIVHHLSEYPPEHIAKVIRALGRQHD